MNSILKTSVKMAAMGAVMMGASAANAGVDFGKRGEAVNLVIGYQPYYTESWTGVVNNGKSFFGKNIFQLDRLPSFKELDFRVQLSLMRWQEKSSTLVTWVTCQLLRPPLSICRSVVAQTSASLPHLAHRSSSAISFS